MTTPCDQLIVDIHKFDRSVREILANYSALVVRSFVLLLPLQGGRGEGEGKVEKDLHLSHVTSLNTK